METEKIIAVLLVVGFTVVSTLIYGVLSTLGDQNDILKRIEAFLENRPFS
jgi:hypothetical protein